MPIEPHKVSTLHVPARPETEATAYRNITSAFSVLHRTNADTNVLISGTLPLTFHCGRNLTSKTISCQPLSRALPVPYYSLVLN